MSVRRLLEEFDSAELAEWLAFANLEGFGEIRADYRAAQICAILANIHRGKDTEPYTPEQFMPALRVDEEIELQRREPLLLPDPTAQSKLILAAIFGKET